MDDRDEIPESWHYCPLCGDAFWADGTECRMVREAKAAGTFIPRFDEKTREPVTESEPAE